MFERLLVTLFMLKRLLHFGPILALFIIFSCSIVAIIDCILWTWKPNESWFGKIQLFFFILWVSLILRNFFLAVFVGPGLVPLGWKPDNVEDENFMQFCYKCDGFKPLRAHHCRKCERCVLKMDHHCPWINNCCGHLNHGYFLSFLFFVPIGCLHAVIIYCVTIYKYIMQTSFTFYNSKNYIHFSANALLMNIIVIGLAFGTTVAVSLLFYYQAKSVIINQTGIEQWIVEKAEDRTDLEDVFKYPYDYGWKENIKQVVNWSCKPNSDGYNWVAIEGCHKYSLSIEQLKQKEKKKKRIVLYYGIEDYSGRLLPCSKGLKTACCIPYSDDPRIPIKKGDCLHVTRASTYWLYGEKQFDKTEKRPFKGWFPRKCAKRVGKIIELVDDEKKKDK